MSYVPDPTNVNQPTSDVKAGTADDEFRALKAYIQGLVLGAVSQGPTVRQTALIGSQDSSGDPNFLSAGTGLALNLSALSAPLALTYAAGSGAAGDINYSEAIGADVTDVVTGLQPGNLSYITKLHNGAWDKTLAPCQYGKVYDKTAQMLMRWAGINNAVVATEDFGNALTFFGNAKLSTATQILGLNTVALDGTGDYVTTPMSSLGNNSWEVFGSFRLAAVGIIQTILNLSQAGSYHGLLAQITTANRIELYISSDGATNGIVNGNLGATVLAINTTYYYRIVYDALAGSYRMYLSINGAAEIQDQTSSSALKIASIATAWLGAQYSGLVTLNGNLGYIGIRRWASFTSAQATGPTVAPTFVDVKSDFFSIPQMKMYEVTAISTVAGTAPTLTAINKLYLGEVTTGAVAVTTAISYAFKGRYDSGKFAVAASTAYPLSHRIGTVPEDFKLLAYTINGLVDGPVHLYNVGYYGLNYGAITSTSVSLITQAGIATTDGLTNGLTAAFTAARLLANRGW